MYYLVNKIIINLIPLLPKFFVKLFANKYVAGVKTSHALKIVSKLNNNGFSCTLDILGEHTADLEESDAITYKYIDILDKIKSNNLDCNISIKPSHIGSDIGSENFNQNIAKLIIKANKNNNFIIICGVISSFPLPEMAITLKTLESGWNLLIINSNNLYKSTLLA